MSSFQVYFDSPEGLLPPKPTGDLSRVVPGPAPTEAPHVATSKPGRAA